MRLRSPAGRPLGKERSVTEKEAYALWHRADRLEQDWRRECRRIEQDVESLRLDIMSARDRLAKEAADSLRAELASNARYRKVVDAFLDLRGFRKDPDGWRTACNAEPGLWKKTRGTAWPLLWNAIVNSRKERKNG